MSETAQWFAQARGFHEQGRFADAEALYRRILAAEPDHVEALHHLGTLEFRAGRHAEGEARLRRALILRPQHLAVQVNLGRMLRNVGRIDDALDCFRAALDVDRFFVPALIGLSDALLSSARLREAVEPARRAVGLEPERGEAQNVLGAALQALGESAAALQHLDRAAALMPDNANVHYNRGVALQSLGRKSEAVAAYERAIVQAPELIEPRNNLGMLLNDMGEHHAALAQLRAAEGQAPDNAIVQNNLGTTFLHLGVFESALASLTRAVELDPGYAEAHANIGGLLRAMGRLDEAAERCRQALALKPDLPDTHYNLAVVLRELGQLDPAAACIEQAIALANAKPAFYSTRGLIKNDLGLHREALASCRQAIELQPDAAAGYQKLLGILSYSELAAAARFAEHRRFGETFGRAASVAPGFPAIVRARDRRLRVGYLSSDLRGNHPVARNLRPFFLNRDRAAYEIFTYAEVPAPDATTTEFQQMSDGWRSTVGHSDREVASVIADDRIDLLVAVAGHFDRNRSLAAAHRAAPVQLNLFDPTTSGLAAMDYLVADAVMVPRHTPERFVERVIRFPHLYVHEPMTDAPDVGPLPCSTGKPVTFGCFNNPAKLSDACLTLWSEVLKAVPSSRLLLRFRNWYGSAVLRDRLQRRFEREGIAPDRIEILQSDSPGTHHLEIYNQIDIALDAYPFTGSTTTFESLWMGVPVVTRAGDHLMARWTASMLGGLGMTDLVASSPDAFVRIAAGLAADRTRLGQLRTTLRQRITASRLCNGAARTRQLERFYRALWWRWCARQGA